MGETAELTLSFEPTRPPSPAPRCASQSDDPDEANLDVGVTVLGRVQPLASAEKRAACLKRRRQQMRRFTKKHLNEWARCQGGEAEGFACDAGARDRKLLARRRSSTTRSAARSDKRCEAAGLTPRLVGQPEICGGGCGEIELGDFTDLADCLVCRQEEETDAMLDAALGAAPPDLPPNVVAGGAANCATQLLTALEKGIAKTQKLLGACELENVTAAEPVDCRAT